MLKMKYIPDFKNNQPYLLIVGAAEDFWGAAHFLRQNHPAVLDDPSIAIAADMGVVEPLLLAHDECIGLANVFERIAGSKKPVHYYFDIKSLPHAEIIISYNEYDKLI